MFKVVCPYCKNRKAVSLNGTHPNLNIIHCENPKCVKKWHKGIYGASYVEIQQRDKRGLGRNRPTIYTIRYQTSDRGERLLTFRSLEKNLIMKKGDRIILSFKKISKGIFRKQWTGKWDDRPSILLNVTIANYWII